MTNDTESWVARQRAATSAAIAAAESPAEARLLVELFAHARGGAYVFGPPGVDALWTITTQVEVLTCKGMYRLDVAAERGSVRVDVEVDGWSFHHASDEQEARDATRELALKFAGWHTVRLHAWEIAQDAPRVVERLARTLESLYLEATRPPRPPSPNADIIERLERGGMSVEEENDALREVERRARERMSKRVA